MNNFVIPTEEISKNFENSYNTLKESIKAPNVLLLGQTGVGKSSLINTIFGNDLAAVSHTKPETRGFHEYKSPKVPVTIIDSEGYELVQSNRFIELLNQYLNENFADISKQVHIAWYCISLSSARVLPYDLDNIEYILKERKIPVCVVFTQCDFDDNDGREAKRLTDVVSKRFGNSVCCFQTSNDEKINEFLDIEKLVDWSMNNLSDDNLRIGFLIAQKADLQKKEELIQEKIKNYMAGAAAIGFTPIPVSDAILLTGLQVKMASDIFTIYGINNSMSLMLRNIIAGRVVSTLGKSVAGNLLKFIPGIGSVAGGLINAGVASAITFSMGNALNVLCKKAVEQAWSNDVKSFDAIFTEENLNQLIENYKK